MNQARNTIAAIRMSGRPDVLFVDVAGNDVRRGDAVTVATASGPMDAQVVIAPSELAGDFGVLENALAGALERRGAEIVVTLTGDAFGPTARHIGAAIRRASPNDGQSSIEGLYREFESSCARLGRRVDTEQGSGIIVALDRERGVAVIELDSGQTLEIESQAQE